MTVSELFNNMSTRYYVKLKRVLYCKKYFLSMYRANMMLLYDKGYISDPTRFNEKEIYSNIVDLNIDGMISIDGSINLSLPQIRFATYLNKKNPEAVAFLQTLEEALRYRTFSNSVDQFYETYKMICANVTRIDLRLRTLSCDVYSKNTLRLDEGLFECLIEPEEQLETFNIKEGIWNIAMGILKIPESRRSLDGLFVSQLTHSEEVDCLELILDGDVTVNGKFAKQLEDWLLDHKWSKQTFSSKQKGLYSYILFSYEADIKKLQNKLIGEMENSNVQPFFYCKDLIFGKVKKTNTVLPLGQFQILQMEDEELIGSDLNILEGYTGEAYFLDYLDQEGIFYTGCPIELYTYGKDTEFFIDLEQTEVKDYKTWFEVNGASVIFDELEIKPVNPEDKLASQLRTVLRNARCGECVTKLGKYYGEQELEKAKQKIFQDLQKAKRGKGNG